MTTKLEQIRERADDPIGTMRGGVGPVDEDRDYLLAKLDAIRDLANAHGRQGFNVTPNDIRTTLDAEVDA